MKKNYNFLKKVLIFDYFCAPAKIKIADKMQNPKIPKFHIGTIKKKIGKKKSFNLSKKYFLIKKPAN